jgi:hypothetical protein
LIHEELANYSTNKLIQLVLTCDDKLSEKIISNMLEKYEINKIMAELYLEGDQGDQIEEGSEFELSLCNPKSDKSIGTSETTESREVISTGATLSKVPKGPRKSTLSMKSLVFPG